jgi:hypothetical protein
MTTPFEHDKDQFNQAFEISPSVGSDGTRLQVRT